MNRLLPRRTVLMALLLLACNLAGSTQSAATAPNPGGRTQPQAGAHGGSGQPTRVSTGTYLPVGPLLVAVERSMLVLPCMPRPHNFGWYRAGPGREFLQVSWWLRNPTDRDYYLPHPNHPGFRLLLPDGTLAWGQYRSYPGYSSIVPAHKTISIPWSFIIPEGTTRAVFTYVPPGSRSVQWTTQLPRAQAIFACQ